MDYSAGTTVFTVFAVQPVCTPGATRTLFPGILGYTCPLVGR